MVYKIGFDIHGVLDHEKLGPYYAELTRMHYNAGNEVHIITGAEQTKEIVEQLKSYGVVWTHFFSITDYHISIGTDVTYDKRNLPYMGAELWNPTKGDYARRISLDMHYDDSNIYHKYFSTPYCRVFNNDQSAKRVKVAILGGSFNPVTEAHMGIANHVLDSIKGLQMVWLLPTYVHRFGKHKDYNPSRIELIKSVTTNHIRYCGYEVENELSGGTLETVTRLLNDSTVRDKYDISYIIGSDCLHDFDHKWRHSDTLANTVPFVVVPREGYPIDGYDGLLSESPHTILRDAKIPELSSTMVRKKLKNRESIKGLVPKAVEKLIHKNNLYQT